MRVIGEGVVMVLLVLVEGTTTGNRVLLGRLCHRYCSRRLSQNHVQLDPRIRIIVEPNFSAVIKTIGRRLQYTAADVEFSEPPCLGSIGMRSAGWASGAAVAAWAASSSKLPKITTIQGIVKRRLSPRLSQSLKRIKLEENILHPQYNRLKPLM